MNRLRRFFITLALVLAVSLVLPGPASAFNGTVEAEAAVKMNTKKISLEVGEKYTLKIKGSAKAFNWTSSDKSVASVKRVKKYKNRGTVTAVSAGTAVIIATRGSKSYVCTVTVTNGSGKAAPTPTKAPVATPTPAPKPTATPAATPTPTPTAAPASNAVTSYTSPYTGNTFEITDGYTTNLFMRNAASIDESRVKLLLPSYESFMGGEISEGNTVDHDGYYEKNFSGSWEQSEELKEYINLLISEYDMTQEYYNCTYGTYYTWGFKYNGTAGIDKGKVEYSYSDLYGYDLIIQYYYEYVVIYYPKDVEFVYTSDAATGKVALDASIERTTMEKTTGKELYFNIYKWSDNAADSINVFLPEDIYSDPEGTTYSFDQFTAGSGNIYFSAKDITGIGNTAVSNGKNSKIFKDIRVSVVEHSEEAFNVYYYFKIEASSGAIYEFEGIRATERLSTANFKSNGSVTNVKNGNTVYYPVDGATYVIDKGSTITIEGPFETESYKGLYGYSFLTVQKGIVDVSFKNATDTYCTVKGVAAGETIMKIGLVGSVNIKHEYQLKYGNQRIKQTVNRLEPRFNEIMIKIKVE